MSKKNILKIGHLIKKLRKSKNIDVKTLAKNVGLSKQSIYYVESDRKSPTFDTIIKIVDGLDATIPELFQDEKDAPSPGLVKSLIEQLNSKQKTIDNLNDSISNFGNENKSLLKIIEKEFT